jgi:transcriptional regulator with XRE-family HTH domain
MMLIRISGSQLHAARVLVGLSREEVAERVGLCRHSRRWFRGARSQGILIRVAIARETAKRLAKSTLFALP